MADELVILRRIVAHMCCGQCAENHMEMPESVSCYCDCHSSSRDAREWAEMKSVALSVWPSRAEVVKR